MQFNPSKPESKLASLGKMFIGPLFAAFMGFMGSYIGIQKDISTVTTAIVRMSTDISELKQKQDSLHKDYYLITRGEWSEQKDKLSKVITEHEEVRRQMQNVTEDIRLYHAPDSYKARRLR